MTLFYIDISNVQWGLPFTRDGAVALVQFLRAAKAEGMSGAVHKVSQGANFADPYYWPTFRSWCESNDFSWLGYHFADTSDPAAQARNFVANDGGPYAMLDFENGAGDIDNFWNVVNAFNDVGVNVSQSYLPEWYDDDIGDPDLSSLTANQISLVSSNYAWEPTGSPADIYNALGGDNGPGWQPYGGATPSVWQFSQMASVGGITVDCNAYRGTSLDALFTGNVF